MRGECEGYAATTSAAKQVEPTQGREAGVSALTTSSPHGAVLRDQLAVLQERGILVRTPGAASRCRRSRLLRHQWLMAAIRACEARIPHSISCAPFASLPDITDCSRTTRRWLEGATRSSGEIRHRYKPTLGHLRAHWLKTWLASGERRYRRELLGKGFVALATATCLSSVCPLAARAVSFPTRAHQRMWNAQKASVAERIYGVDIALSVRGGCEGGLRLTPDSCHLVTQVYLTLR